MIFATYWFLAFAVVLLTADWLIRIPVARLLLIGVACVIFHAHFAGPAGVLPILVLAIICYFAAYHRNKTLCLAGIVLCVAALCFYKYTVFFAQFLLGAINPGWAQTATREMGHLLPSAPPLAISFFAFEFIHYLYDVRKGAQPLRNPLHFGIFSIYFPSLVAGPIKRYEQFVPSLLHGVSHVSSRDVAMGLVQVATGYLKKITADNLTLYLDLLHPHYAGLPMLDRWIYFTSIAFRILLDFSGYSDIAIGLARMMGIRLPPNFDWPYLATSIQDFWKRWHMSLSFWIRDYVYIPLGGSRHGIPRRIFNGMVAFGLCGLWHGAAWNFVIWGIYHGAGLGVCATYRHLPAGIGSKISRVFERVPLAGWFITQAFVWFGWLIFFYPLTEALRMASKLFGS